MTKAEIIRKVASSTGMEKAAVAAVIEGFMQEVKSSLHSRENVYLRGFGTFEVRHRSAKKGRDIRKNITVEVPEKDIAVFKPGKELDLK